MNREEAHKLVNQLFDLYDQAELLGTPAENEQNTNIEEVATQPRVLPEGKRAVRTKSSGDRVYLLDEVKKTRQWVTTGENLTALGFEMEDVIEVDDKELLGYNMAAAIYRVEPDANA